MTIKVHPIIAGSNAPLEVQFLDAATDDAVSLVGCTGYSATAKNTGFDFVIAGSVKMKRSFWQLQALLMEHIAWLSCGLLNLRHR